MQLAKSKDIESQLQLLFVIYEDFESILLKHEFAERSPNGPWSDKYQTHQACGFGLHTVSTGKRFFKDPLTYFGEESAEKFLDKVLKESASIRQPFDDNITMNTFTPT